jgi:hypothetical protein
VRRNGQEGEAGAEKGRGRAGVESIGCVHSIFLADLALKENNIARARQRLDE